MGKRKELVIEVVNNSLIVKELTFYNDEQVVPNKVVNLIDVDHSLGMKVKLKSYDADYYNLYFIDSKDYIEGITP
jgi:hypothetical protein